MTELTTAGLRAEVEAAIADGTTTPMSNEVILDLLDEKEALNARLAAAEEICEMVEDDIDIFALPARYGLMRTVWTLLKEQSEETE